MYSWKAKIMVVSTDIGLVDSLAHEGYVVMNIGKGEEAKKVVLNPMVNIGHDLCSLVLLDARIPGIDTQLVAEEIRQLSNVPIIVYGQRLGVAMRGVHYLDGKEGYPVLLTHVEEIIGVK